MHVGKKEDANPLWTRDFTIITLGSVVSMFGNAMSGFALSLMVLDKTASSFLYAVFITVFTLPQMVVPVFSGAVLDRFSRKKTIYILDFISAVLFGATSLLLGAGWFDFALFAVLVFTVGCISSMYTVAYQSFYPLLITPGNFSKAYSVSALIETASAVMIPVSTFLYKRVGIAPLLAANSVSFFVAAVMETRIGAKENYIEKRIVSEGNASGRALLHDIREGFGYLFSEKGLLAVAVYFFFYSFAAGAASVITLPYFKANYENGEYVYMLVWGLALVGRAAGGLVHYRVKMPAKLKYAIALIVYVTIAVEEGIYMYFSIPVMCVLCFTNGLLGVTSYNIRISATQSYVPDEKKGRFNGAFSVLNTTGNFAGDLIAGALAVAFPSKYVLSAVMLFTAFMAVVVIGGSRKAVSAIFNQET